MRGNNIKAAGFYRLNVLLYENTLSPTTSTGRFYLPDNTFLQSKYIVGIQTLVYESGSTFPSELPQSAPAESVQGVNCIFAQPGQLTNFYLTLYDKNNKLTIENFPLLQLNNNQYFTPNQPPFNKIIPICGRFNFRESFVYTPSQSLGANTQTCLTFYYL